MKQLIERRQYMQRLRDLKDRKIIKVITGVRSCGKSTLVRMFTDELLQSGILPEQIQFYDFEAPDICAIEKWKDLYAHIKGRILLDKVNYVFLDEFQTVELFHYIVQGLFIKKNVDLYVISSNASLFSGKFATLFMKEYVEISVLPLQFSEYYDFFASKFSNISKMECLENYLMEGGVPEYLNQKEMGQEEADEFMRGVLDTIIKKEVFTQLKIKKKRKAKRKFNRMIYFIFDSLGSFSLPNTIHNAFLNAGTNMTKKAIARHLDALCDMFLLYRAPHFEIRNKELLQTLHKYYFVDPCFRKVCFLRQEMKQGNPYWLENMVYFELLRRNKNVYVGLIDNKEVDFVATDHSGHTSYYQVSWSTTKREVLRRELASLKLIENSNPKYLLTMDMDFTVYNDIHKVNVVDWLLT